MKRNKSELNAQPSVRSSSMIYTLRRMDGTGQNPPQVIQKTIVRSYSTRTHSSSIKVATRVMKVHEVGNYNLSERREQLQRDKEEEPSDSQGSLGTKKNREPEKLTRRLLSSNKTVHSPRWLKNTLSESSLSLSSQRRPSSALPYGRGTHGFEQRPQSAPSGMANQPWVGIRDMTPLQKNRYLIALEKENSSKTTIEMEEKPRHKEKKQIIRERYSPESHYVLYDEENIPMASNWENPNKFLFSDMPDRAKLTSMEQIEYDTLAATNLLRTRPGAFAQMLGMLKEFYSSDGTEFRAPGLNSLVKPGGLADLEDCIEYLKNQTPVPPLVYSKALSLACRDFAEDSDKNGLRGNNGLNQSVFSRCEKYGKPASGDGGENITYGENTGIGTVIDLVLQGNHRTELFVNQYKMMGIGCVQHSNSKNICVCAFASSFIDRVKRSDEKRSKIPKGISPQYTGPLVPPIISSSNWSKVNLLAFETIIASLGSRKKELKTKKVKGPTMLRKTAISAVHPLTGKLEAGPRVDFVFQLSGECSVERYILFNNGKPYPFRLQLPKYLTLTLKSLERPSVTISEQVDSTQLIPVLEYQVE